MRNRYGLLGKQGAAAWLLLLALLAGPRAWAQSAPTWQAAVATAGTVQVQAIATDANGRVLLTGSFSGSATFGSTTLSSSAGREVFVAKWNPATSSFIWAVQGTSNGTSSQQNVAYGLAVSGPNVYLTGGFDSGTLQFGNAQVLTNVQAGTSDVFVTKLMDAGSTASFTWSRRAGGAGADYATSVAVGAGYVFLGGRSEGGDFDTHTVTYQGGFIARCFDYGGPFTGLPIAAGYEVTALAFANQSVYATGRFTSATTTFTGNSGTITNRGGDDVFVANYGSSTIFNWLQVAGSSGNDNARALAATAGSVYVAGSFTGPSASFGSTTLTNAGASSLFVSKLTAAGSFGWALQNGGSNASADNAVYGLAAFGSSVYLAGTFGGSASFGSTGLTSAGGSDVLLAKLVDSGSSGAFAWAQQAGGSGADYAYGVANYGRLLYVGGQVAGPATFGSFTVGAAGAQPSFVASAVDPAPVVRLMAPNLGPVGSIVTLYGTGLSGTTAVTFAGTSNNVVTSGFTVNAAGTQLSGVVVPAGAVTGSVDVTTPQGVSNGLVTFTVTPTANAAPAWQTATGAEGNTSYIRYAAADASGNVFVLGVFNGTLTLGATTLTSAGFDDLFIAKWNPTTGNYAWAMRAGGDDYEIPYALVTTSAGIYLAGYFGSATINFGSVTLTNTYASYYDGFVVKIVDSGSSGSVAWAQLIGGDEDEYIESLAVSGTSVYVGGDYTSATLLLGSGSLSTPNLSSDDGFVAKFTDNGSSASFRWVVRAGNSSGDFTNFYALAVRGTSVYAGGYFYGTVNYGSTSLTSAGGADVMVARITDLGSTASFTAATRAGSTANDYTNALITTSNGIYLAGYTYSYSSTWGSSTLSRPGGVVAKLTDAGGSLGFVWGQLAGDRVYQLAANGSSVYAVGSFSGTSDVGSSVPLYGVGSSDGFVTRLTDAGSAPTVQWAQQFGGLGADSGYALALAGTSVCVGGSVVPAAAFGSLPVLTPVDTRIAALAAFTDPAILATAPPVAAAALALYPNPAHEAVTVPLPAGASGAVTVHDGLSREVRRQPVAAGAAEVQLDLRGLAPGLYLVRQPGTGAAQHLAVE